MNVVKGTAKESATQTKKEEKLTLRVDPVPFPRLLQTGFGTTSHFSQLINNIFKPIFPDYLGSKIELRERGVLVPFLFFYDSGITPAEGQFKGIEEILSRKQISSPFDYITMTNQATISTKRDVKKYALTNEAKELLFDVIPSAYVRDWSKCTADWDKITAETSQSISKLDNRTVLCHSVMIDFNRIIKHIYGFKAENGTPFYYNVMVGNPIMPSVQPNNMPGAYVANKWQIFIMRTDKKTVDAVAEETGIVNSTNALGIEYAF